MASISALKGGRRAIQFVGGDGVRRSIRLGKCSQKQADAIKVRVEQLITASNTGIMDPEAASWITIVDDRLHARLARAGLVIPREFTRPTIGSLMTTFLKTKSVKPATHQVYLQTRKSLVGHFGKDRLLSTVTPLDAERWRKSMVEENLATATISKRIQVAKQAFGRAVKWGMLRTSPLAGLKAGSQTNPERAFYVTRAVTEKVLAACPDPEWRLIVGLCRFAGLRCPSEVLGLRWIDVRWDTNRLIVRSPKTAHHEGKSRREVPIAPELRPLLLAAFEAAEDGEEFLITGPRRSSTNLRTQFSRIVTKAGLDAWPRLFQNLRASCETDWVTKHPAHVAAAWLGHSVTIANKHYLQVRDSDFDSAAGVTPGRDAGGEKSGAESGAVEVQNAVQHTSAPNRGDSTDEPEVLAVGDVAPNRAGEHDSVRNDQWAILDSNQ